VASQNVYHLITSYIQLTQTSSRKQEDVEVAKPIGLETVLVEEHARAFHEYMERNVIHETLESRQVIREARDLSKRFKFL